MRPGILISFGPSGLALCSFAFLFLLFMSIGRVLEHLKDNDMLDDTVIVFMSDNGGR
jgi:hypothetical protein